MGRKRVLVIFKTHLDVGFTDLAEKVCDRYLNVFLPNAIRVGYELRNTETPFVWTVGSWLVFRVDFRLSSAAPERRKSGIVDPLSSEKAKTGSFFQGKR